MNRPILSAAVQTEKIQQVLKENEGLRNPDLGRILAEQGFVQKADVYKVIDSVIFEMKQTYREYGTGEGKEFCKVLEQLQTRLFEAIF